MRTIRSQCHPCQTTEYLFYMVAIVPIKELKPYNFSHLYAFIYSVEAQRGREISNADADALIAAAQAII